MMTLLRIETMDPLKTRITANLGTKIMPPLSKGLATIKRR